MEGKPRGLEADAVGRHRSPTFLGQDLPMKIQRGDEHIGFRHIGRRKAALVLPGSPQLPPIRYPLRSTAGALFCLVRLLAAWVEGVLVLGLRAPRRPPRINGPATLTAGGGHAGRFRSEHGDWRSGPCVNNRRRGDWSNMKSLRTPLLGEGFSEPRRKQVLAGLAALAPRDRP